MRAELNARRAALIKSGKAADEAEVEEIEKLMLEKGIQNHEVAADYRNWMNQAATPTPATYRSNMIDEKTGKSLSEFYKNPVHAARSEAQQALNDIRTGKVRLG